MAAQIETTPPPAPPVIAVVMSRAGDKLHRAYATGGPTFCGVRLIRGRRVITGESAVARCAKCFPELAGFPNRAED